MRILRWALGSKRDRLASLAKSPSKLANGLASQPPDQRSGMHTTAGSKIIIAINTGGTEERRETYTGRLKPFSIQNSRLYHGLLVGVTLPEIHPALGGRRGSAGGQKVNE